jgi:hypothetical protein
VPVHAGPEGVGADGDVMARQRLISFPACRLGELAADRLDLRGPRSRSSAPGGTRVAPWRGSPARPGTPGQQDGVQPRRSRHGPCTITRAPSGPVTRLTPGVIFSAAAAIGGSGNWARIHPIRADHLLLHKFSLPLSSKQPATRRNADQPACRRVNARSYVNSTGLLTAGVKPPGEPSLPHTSGMCDHTSEANR